MSNIQTSLASLKASISGAMNHVDGKIGDLSLLETADKASLVAGVNEVCDMANENETNITTYLGYGIELPAEDMTTLGGFSAIDWAGGVPTAYHGIQKLNGYLGVVVGLSHRIGDLSTLATTNKESAVAAINEIEKTGSIESGFFAHYEYFEPVTDPNTLFVEGGVIGVDTVLQPGDRIFVSYSISDFFGNIYTVNSGGDSPSLTFISFDKFVIQIDRSYLYEYNMLQQDGSQVTKTDYSRNGYYYINKKGDSYYNKQIQLSTKNSKEVSYHDQTVEQGLDGLHDSKMDKAYVSDGMVAQHRIASQNNDTGILSSVIAGGGRSGSDLAGAGDIIYQLVAIGSTHDYTQFGGVMDGGLEAGKLIFRSASDWSTLDQRASLEVKTSGADGMQTRFIVDDAGAIEVVTPGQGVIMASPNGTRYKLQVDDSGNLATTAV